MSEVCKVNNRKFCTTIERSKVNKWQKEIIDIKIKMNEFKQAQKKYNTNKYERNARGRDTKIPQEKIINK